MFRSRLAKLETVHEARTREERDAVFAFRYTVYVEELGAVLEGADHERRIVHDQEDESEGSIHLYTGSIDDISSSARLRIWAAGQIPQDEFDMFSMGQFPGIENMVVSDVGRLMIRPSLRGRLLFPALVRGVFRRGLDAGVELGFCHCAPGLVQHYRRLGYRPYAAPLVPTEVGLHVPMVGIPSDVEHFKAMGSPVASLAARHFGTGSGKDTVLDLTALDHLLDPDAAALELESEQVWREVQRALLDDGAESSILEGLTERDVRKLTGQGFMLNVVPDTMVTREGFGEKGMYVVLDGTLEVLNESGVRLSVLGRGELFGELAFFRDDGRRTATVRAVSDCRLLVIRRHVLDELGKSDPQIALRLHFNLGRIMAERLVRAERRVAI